MYNKELGFVLKRFLPNKNKLSVLTQHSGKIEVISRPSEKTLQLWPGMLISFHKTTLNNRMFFGQNIEIVMSPFFDNTLDINWIHHILEICYYFSPLQSPANEIFEHLYKCFNLHVFKKYFDTQIPIIKKLYIVKLLESLGFYPTKELIIYLSLYQELCSMYIDFIDKDMVKILKNNLEKIKIAHIEKINNWIFKTIAIHPNFKQFKTMRAKNFNS